MSSLSLKASIAGGAALAAVFGIGMSILVSQIGGTITEQTRQLQESSALAQANAVRARLDAAERTAETLVSAIGSMKKAGVTERAAYEPVLRDALARYPELFGTWVGFEPNILDGKDAQHVGQDGHDATGRFIPYWNRGGGVLRREKLKTYTVEGAGDYYLQPQRQNRAMALGPYVYPVAGKDTLMMSFGAPVVVEGRFVGVGGVDISLEALHSELSAVKPFGDGYVALMSQTGLAVAHPNAAASGKPLADFDKPAAEAARRAIESGRSVESDAIGTDGAAWRFLAMPIQAGGTKEVWAVVTAVPVATLTATVTETRWTVIGLSAACVLIVGLLLFGLMKLIVDRSLRSLGATVSRMAAGDHEIDIPEATRRDDVGLIGRAVVQVREGLKARAAEDAAREAEAAAGRTQERRRVMSDLATRFETAVGGIVGLVSSAATELKATATELTASAEAAAAQSAVVSAAAADGSDSIGTVASAAEQLGSAVSEIAHQVTRSAGLTTEAVSEAASASEVMGELSASASRIGDIVKLVSEIADQTNLLALNATIEAARAGEAGRGFAVVATEVKSLAEQTSRAIGDITAQITAIQASTGRAVTAIDGIRATIGSVNDVTVAMSAAIEEQNASSQEIVGAVHRAARGSASVTQNISGVARTAEDTQAAAGSVLGAASDLSAHADRLGAEVVDFLATIRAA